MSGAWAAVLSRVALPGLVPGRDSKGISKLRLKSAIFVVVQRSRYYPCLGPARGVRHGGAQRPGIQTRQVPLSLNPEVIIIIIIIRKIKYDRGDHSFGLNSPFWLHKELKDSQCPSVSL